MYFFVTGGGKPAEMGEHQLGVVAAEKFTLCKAVAASSAFPPVFPPLRISAESYEYAEGEYVTLTDGGVYDSLGVNPLLRERNKLDYAIVSDGGKPFENNERPTESGAVVLYESINILMEQVRGLHFKRLELAHQSGKGPKPLWFSIDSQIGESQPGDASFASAIGTNLKKLNAAEMDVLTRHSGALLNHRMATYANELLTVS